MVAIGIICGSTRQGRVGIQVARWAAQRAEALHRAQVDFVDLAEVALPFLDEPEHASLHNYQHQHTRDWSRRVSTLDTMMLVTPEYNGSYSAVLKNALDYLCDEWHRKPVGIIGYGGTSAGTRAVQALVPVVTALGMVPAGAVYLLMRQRLDETGALRTTGGDEAALDGLLADLVDLVDRLSPQREAPAVLP